MKTGRTLTELAIELDRRASARISDEIAAILAMGIMAVAMLCLLNGTLLNLTVASAPLSASGIPAVMEQR